MEEIGMGNSYLLNLTCRTPVMVNESLLSIYFYAKAKYKIFYKDQFVCFSPEPFIRIVGNSIYTFPMKGTCDPHLPGAKEKLLADHKEKSEHYTIVDLLRNDLSKVAASVSVEKFRFFEEIETLEGKLLQTSSKIRGKLPTGWQQSLGDIFDKLLPAGSICGAPKNKTIEIITRVENYDRGYYTGVAGFFSGEQLDSCVMIRFIEKENGQYFYKSGGGITSQSNCRMEYDEMIKKIYVPIR
jgi:para-aminobenzoate synthetase component 1